jgi:hypothetical protein
LLSSLLIRVLVFEDLRLESEVADVVKWNLVGEVMLGEISDRDCKHFEGDECWDCGCGFITAKRPGGVGIFGEKEEDPGS